MTSVPGVTLVDLDLPAGGDVGVVSVFALMIVLGEWFRLSAPGFRGSAPIATAAAFGLALDHGGCRRGTSSATGPRFVLAVTAVAMVIGTATRVLAGRDVSLVETTGRFVAMPSSTVVYRNVYLGQSPGTEAPSRRAARRGSRPP